MNDPKAPPPAGAEQPQLPTQPDGQPAPQGQSAWAPPPEGAEQPPPPTQPYNPYAQPAPQGQSVWAPPQPPAPPGGNGGSIPQPPYPPPYPPYGTAQQPQPYSYPGYPPNYVPPEQAPPAQSSRRGPIMAGIAVVGLILAVVALSVGGELGSFVLIGVAIVPLAILAALAYAGVKNFTAQVFAYIWLAFVAFGVLFFPFAYVLSVVTNTTGIVGGAIDGSQIFRPGAAPTILWTVLLLALAVIAACAMLFRPVRALMSRIMPIDPDNFVHKIALCIITLITLSFYVPLIALAGRPPLLELVNRNSSALGDQGLAGPLETVYQFVWTIPAVLVAAGWPIARRFRPALDRLGMVRPTLAQVGAGVGLGLGLAVVASLVIDPVIRQIWTALGWGVTDSAAFDKLLSNLITPAGAVLIGVTAGIGEEMTVRGLLQPR
ncbi:MAG: hypothetical protein ACJ78Q_18870, partial [Chloroflexia bacterium]